MKLRNILDQANDEIKLKSARVQLLSYWLVVAVNITHESALPERLNSLQNSVTKTFVSCLFTEYE